MDVKWNTTFLELTFPNSGCRSAATLRLFRSSTYQYVRFVFGSRRDHGRCGALGHATLVNCFLHTGYVSFLNGSLTLCSTGG